MDGADARIDLWKRSLLDLSLRNRLLDARDSTRAIAVGAVDPIAVAAALGGGLALELVAGEGTLADRRLPLVIGPEELERRLTIMSRALREGLAEGGVHTLWLGLGMLRWRESDEIAEHRAPLALWPVTVKRSGKKWTLAAAGDDARLNDTLIEKLRVDLGVTVADEDEGDGELDLAAVMARFEAAIAGRTGWAIEPGAVLGVFSFAKLAMWTDLGGRGDAAEWLRGSPVVAHLTSGTGGPLPETRPLPDAARLDERPIADCLMPMDCDSSQLAAVLAGADGASFVLQGPPGTGKSQTITNLIAVALARGKTVLFVSEKIAALEVVERRLAAIGLGSFCLELHSHKAAKRRVVDALGAVLDRSWRPAIGAGGDDARLAGLRAELDDYVLALHQPGPLGLSVHDALARLGELRDAAPLALDDDAAHIDAAGFTAGKRALADYARAAAAVGAVVDHPWRTSTLEVWTLTTADTVAAAVAALATATEAMTACAAAWAEAVPGITARTVAEQGALGHLWQVAARTPRPGAELIATASRGAGTRPEQTAVPERLALAHARAQTLAIDKAGALRDPEQWLAAARLADDLDLRLADRWTDAVDALDLEALAPRFRKWAGRFGLWRWFALRGPRRLVRGARVGTLPADEIVAADLEAAIERRRVRRALDQAKPLAARWLGALAPVDGAADLAAIDRAIAWASELRAAFDAVAIGATPADRVGREAAWKALVAQVVAAVPAADDVLLARSAQAFTAWQAAVARLAEVAGVALAGLDAPILASVTDAIVAWRARVGDLRDWTAYVRARRIAREAGVAAACAACERGQVAPEALDQAWERAVLLGWAEREVAAQPALASFSGATHHARVAEHAELDRGGLAVARARIIQRLVERVPRVDADPSGEIAILLRERKKQRGHRPLRRLFKDVPALLNRLAPCLLMSPLSVAQYLDPSLPRFDLVIFDEASQIPTADAIGALARGKAAIVVGDSRQLPPTRFFAAGQGAAEVDDDDDADAPLDSVLDECVAQRLPELRLTWHYRSRHEDLIAFSNARYYGDTLRVFPAAAARTPDLGVEHRDTGGVYDRANTRTNRVEAEAVVAEIVRRLGDPELRDRSIGVVTFSRPQQALIEDLLDDARAADPALERYFGDGEPGEAELVAEPVIVKNLETIQGDERDVMLFSIGYGPDATGALALQFGPLGQAGGERRLNVATTRARQKLIVFSSLGPAHVARLVEDSSAVGVRHLGELLAYAQAGGGAGRPADDGAAVSPVAAAVARGLAERGWIVRHQIGCAGYRIDLAIVDPDDPGRYVLGLETDGEAYASATVARDRDRLRGLVLGELGWRLHRLWSLDWWMDPERELQRAHNAVIAAIAATRAARKSGGVLRPNVASGSGRTPRASTVPPLAARPLLGASAGA
ncbi:MAG: DUF4011 domain-containing protein, partial [Deltaproteobacteria bacterium]|nr:DUF4011 domain-containing protein [Deltaproteobacteria bacterium]